MYLKKWLFREREMMKLRCYQISLVYIGKFGSVNGTLTKICIYNRPFIRISKLKKVFLVKIIEFKLTHPVQFMPK